MRLSPSDLALVRSQPQEHNLYLSLYQPETVFAAQVRDMVSGSGNRVIPYAAVTTGTAAAVLPNFAMLVGETPGGHEYGAVRVRDNSATGTANAFVVAENSHIEWASGAYLTVLNYIDVEAIYPRIIQNFPGSEDVTFYKDYDIPYAGQNTKQGAFVCMGPHRAGMRDPATGQMQLYWSSSGSYNVNGDPMFFAWEFEGGTPTGSALRDPGWVTYLQPGHYRTRLTITSSGTGAGTQDFGVRYVSIYDQPDAGPNRPIVEWELQSLNGSRSEGGYSGRVKIWERVGPEFVKDGQVVVLFSDDFYGQTRKNLGGNAENCAGIFWVGYVMHGSISYNYKEGTVEFDVGSITEMMKQAQGFSISCQDDANPDTWYKIKSLSIQRALYHYLRWHSTVLNITDFQYISDERPVQYYDSNRESIYDAIAKFIESGIKGEIVADRQGKLWTEISAQGRSDARTGLPLCIDLGLNDVGGSPPTNASANASRGSQVSENVQIVERLFPEVAYVDYGGIAYVNAPSGTSIAILSAGPGIAPAYKGTIDEQEGFILTSQQQLNEIVGASYAYQNSRFPEVTVPLVGAYKNIDIAPLERVTLTLPVDATPRRIE